MKNLKNFFLLMGICLGILLGFTIPSFSKGVISVTVDAEEVPAVGEELRININIEGGEGVSGYGVFFVFDTTVLKYIETLPGDYLPKSGIMMAPILTDNDSYAVKLDIEGLTTIGDPATFGPLEVSTAEMLIDLPDAPISEVGRDQGISVIASAAPDIASGADGTLATLRFEVIAATSISAALLEINLSDFNDEPLEADIQDALITTQGKTIIVSPLTPQAFSADVNSDGVVDILDLAFVASQFGKPVTEVNAVADVNWDGQIDILDLAFVAQHFDAPK